MCCSTFESTGLGQDCSHGICCCDCRMCQRCRRCSGCRAGSVSLVAMLASGLLREFLVPFFSPPPPCSICLLLLGWVESFFASLFLSFFLAVCLSLSFFSFILSFSFFFFLSFFGWGGEDSSLRLPTVHPSSKEDTDSLVLPSRTTSLPCTLFAYTCLL